MVLIWFTLVLAALTGFYFLMKRRHGEKPEYVVLAPTGELETSSKSSLEFKSLYNHSILTEDGHLLDESRHSLFRVIGSSMKMAGIQDGDYIIVENIDANSNPIPQLLLKADDIILLYLEGDKAYKIRRIENIEGDKISLSYYRVDEQILSTKQYSISQVKGVVRYVLSRNTICNG